MNPERHLERARWTRWWRDAELLGIQPVFFFFNYHALDQRDSRMYA